MASAESLTVHTAGDASVQAAGGRLRAFLALTKPGITRMVLATTAAGFYMASAGALDWVRLLNTLIGTALVASAAGALNQWVERDADGRMIRTRGRPLPSGRVNRAESFAFAILLATVGVDWLFLVVGLAPAVIVAATLITYVFVYTPMKRYTWWATIVGGLPGALPILAGWAAGGGGVLDAGGLVLFGILFLWQMPHFYALAWIYREDYVRGGFRMLSADDETGVKTASQAFVFTLGLVAVSVVPTSIALSGELYRIGAVVLGAAFTALALALLLRRTNRRAWRLFFASVIYLPALLVLMVVDKLVA